MLHGPLILSIPASVMLWAVSLSMGSLGGPLPTFAALARQSADASAYRITERAAGARAERLIARVLLQGFDEGLELVSVAEEIERPATIDRPEGRDGRRRVVALELEGGERRTVRVVLDRAGRVEEAEVRVSTGGRPRQVYRHKRELSASLAIGRVVHSLALQPLRDGGARLVGDMRGGRRLVVYLTDFEPLQPPRACEKAGAQM